MTSGDEIHPVLRKIKGEGSGYETKFCQDLVMAGFYVKYSQCLHIIYNMEDFT